MRKVFLLLSLLAVGCAEPTEPANTDIERFLSGEEIRELLVGNCITGRLADGRRYRRSWTEDKLEEVHTGHTQRHRWYYYHGEWSVTDEGTYVRTILPWTRYYKIARNGDTVIWVEVDEDGDKLANTYYGVVGGACGRL